MLVGYARFAVGVELKIFFVPRLCFEFSVQKSLNRIVAPLEHNLKYSYNRLFSSPIATLTRTREAPRRPHPHRPRVRVPQQAHAYLPTSKPYEL